MQVNSINNSQPNFQARVSSDFTTSAKKLYQSIGRERRFDAFEEQLGRFNNFGTDDMEVVYKKVFKDDKRQFALVARKDGKEVTLSVKDQFRKLVEKFMHINEYEFNVKTKDLM